jgi:hypothetical protein
MSLNFIEQITKSNQDEQNFLLRYYARVEIIIKLKILARHRKILHTLKQRNEKQNIENISYVSLILAIKFTYNEFKKLSIKKFEDMQINEIMEITLLDIESFKAKRYYKKTKKDKLLKYWGVVKLLRTKGISFRVISQYLKKKYKFNIGYSTIYEAWKEVEKIS